MSYKFVVGGIKTKIIGILLLSIAVFAVTVGWTLFEVKNIQSEMLFESLGDHTKLNSEILSLDIGKQVEILKSIANSPTLKEEDLNSAAYYLKNLIGRKDVGMFSSLGIADAATGERVEALDGKTGNISGAGFFKEITAGKDYVITPPAQCKTYPGLFRVVVAVPVIKDGAIYRVLYARISLEDITNFVNKMKYGEKGRAFVVDSKAICVVSIFARRDKRLG